MEIIRGIYKITSPSGKMYIGRSVNILARFNYYKYSKNNYQRKLCNSFKKYGLDKHKFEIIVSGDFNNSLLNELERHYIQLYNTFNNGLNLTAGGEGLEGMKHTEETKKLLSSLKIGKKFSEEYLKNMSLVRIGVKRGSFSAEHREKISKSHFGIRPSEESRLKMSNSHKGKSVNGKKVKCTITGKIWGSIKECWEDKYTKLCCFENFRRMLVGKRENITSVILL